MCGIVGVVYWDTCRPVSAADIVPMRDLLIYRGPDDCGLFIDGNAGLGHRRLNIIDLHTGRQPMTNEDETLWIVFNGEIYNYQDLRERLTLAGHLFKTRSDTEVILHLYEQEGEACPASLNGIFAFAIWDKARKTLFLARDHMGVKPLYYAVTSEGFYFASEIKSIIQTRRVHACCNEEATAEYFLFRHVSGERTLFRGINSLLPAHTMRIADGKVSVRAFWSPFPSDGKPNIGSFDAAAEELSWLVCDSVKKQLMSDVPLGTFCSGGVDSSLVTAVAASSVSHSINTFSVGFHETEYDETSYARKVSKQYGTRHHETKLTNEEFADLLPKMTWHNDEPLNFSNSIHIYAISKLARDYVTVVLTGEGSDELFCGYPRYLIPSMAGRLRILPGPLRRLLARSASFFRDHRLAKLAQSSILPPDELYLHNAAFLHRDFLQNLLRGVPLGPFSYREETLQRAKALSLDPLTCLSLLDQHNYLVSILNRQDKMSMAASIESRVPLLDYRIVEFANRLPSDFKVRRFTTKALLKRAAETFLPSDIVHRRKSGFGLPLSTWFRQPAGLGTLLNEMLSALTPGDPISSERLTELITLHRLRKQDLSESLWTCLSFWLWQKTFSVSIS